MIKKNKKTKMTLDKLAIIFANSFGGFEKRFNKKLDAKIGEVKTEIGQVRTDLRSFKQETEENFKEVNKNIDDLTETLEETTFNHENRIEALEKV